MLLLAAWQKPSLYKKHLSYKVVGFFSFILIVFFIWEVALTEAVNALPENILLDDTENISESIKTKSVSGTWWGFSLLMFFGGMLLDWIAGISEEHEQSKN
ncbi:hypothetical protein A9Q98_03175 [Thalassotalea sp. 42_200_T64]|nr:hypothetical protein A9Q98_03175 [Thalassotalea sp. 42_200_T64]